VPQDRRQESREVARRYDALNMNRGTFEAHTVTPHALPVPVWVLLIVKPECIHAIPLPFSRAVSHSAVGSQVLSHNADGQDTRL
jgi:hypothetical protein